MSAVPVIDSARPLGFILLAQDLRYADLRAATSRWFTLAAFGVLAVAASLVTFLATRSSRLSWTADLRRFLRGERPSREFQPILRDVRDLAEQVAAESMAEGRGGAWTPERLRRNLRRYLHGEKVIILANPGP